MTAKIVKMEQLGSTVFFNVLFELGGGLAFILTGWKIHDGKLFPPDKAWKGKNYNSVYVSNAMAKLVQRAVVESGADGFELAEEAWYSAKWGQSGLKHVVQTEQLALDIWAKYKDDSAAILCKPGPLKFSPASV